MLLRNIGNMTGPVLGAKIGQRLGWVLVFRVVVATFAGSALMMLCGSNVGWIIGASLTTISSSIPASYHGLPRAVVDPDAPRALTWTWPLTAPWT